MVRTRIYRTLTGTTLSLALAALLSAAPAKAQTNDPNVSGSDRSVTTTTEHRGFDAGWLGLIGLFGLMGRKHARHEEERYRRTEPRTMPT